MSDNSQPSQPQPPRKRFAIPSARDVFGSPAVVTSAAASASATGPAPAFPAPPASGSSASAANASTQPSAPPPPGPASVLDPRALMEQARLAAAASAAAGPASMTGPAAPVPSIPIGRTGPGGSGGRPAWQQRPTAPPRPGAGGTTSGQAAWRKRKEMEREDMFALPPEPGATRTPAPPAAATPTGPAPPPASLHAIQVSPRQRGNPVLDLIRSVAWEFAETDADYVVARTAGVLFLSIKYHRLHPEYIHARIKGLSGHFDLRVMLVLVDVDDFNSSVRELTRIAVVNNMTMVLAWSKEECARYLEINAHANQGREPHRRADAVGQLWDV
ncbi:DNA repair protein rad10, variant [Allomyces macrogynus ATCC 38327]|uniref:DNA repair protein rad10, variant n=1 Tax=Allomyces macrogynus (strain ATCC 38327) TaxID=578462 RepID=A0A0L0S6L9_ALLM3|nr:DNA repair protein rad10, variant [Allomyces macrogynus ATCC 38327]|eukprot:KNE58248.1 DNA repair protein rad10, variant [Allomyces macrogynus ATCC 38327]